MKKQRIENLKIMDNIVRHFNDEDYIEPWLMCGCPDCSTESDYEYIAHDDTGYNEVVKLFLDLVKDVLKESGGTVKF